MTEQQIALREKINEARAKQHKYATWEREKAQEALHLIKEQGRLEDEIIALEYEFALATKAQTMAESDFVWRINKMLGGYTK